MEPGNEGTPPAGGDNSTDWRTGMPEELRDSPALKDFKDVGSLAKSFVDLQKYQGSSIRIPGEDASVESRKEFLDKLNSHVPELVYKPNMEDADAAKDFYRSMGVPEDPTGYVIPEIEGVELPEERSAFLRKLAHDTGITQSQFEKFMGEALEADAQAASGAKTKQEDGMKHLKAEWGLAFDDNMKLAKSAAEATNAPEQLVEAVNTGEVGPEVLKWLHGLGKQIGGEGANISNQPRTPAALAPAEALEKISEMMNNKEHAYWNPHSPDHAASVKKMVELQKAAHPGASASIDNLRVGGGF